MPTTTRLWRPSSRQTKNSQRSCFKLLQILLVIIIIAYASVLFRMPVTTTTTETTTQTRIVGSTKSSTGDQTGQSSSSGNHDIKKHLGEFVQTKSAYITKKQKELSINNDSGNIPVADGRDNDGVNPNEASNGGELAIAREATSRPTTTDEIDYWNLNHTAFYTIPSDGSGNIWDDESISPKLPQWMKSYFNWHKHKRRTWSRETFDKERWIVMQCLGDQDRKCGGTADRLKTVPWVLRVAYYTRRILLIRWTKPNTLESYLVPPVGGFDWRVPDWLAEIMSNVTNGKRLVPAQIIRNYAEGNMTLIRSRYQSFNGGSDWYNDNLLEGPKEPKFDEVFASVWKIFFRPSKPVEQIIRSELTKFKLVPGHYTGAHLRALYAIDSRPKEEIEVWTDNALNCASQLRPGGYPILFASDSDYATSYSHKYVLNKPNNISVVTRTHHPNPPLHLDRAKYWERRPASDYYDTFVDLYLLALAGCVTYNKGGFGHWGLLIGGNITCTIEQDAKTKLRKKCEWVDGDPRQQQRTVTIKEPLFLDAME